MINGQSVNCQQTIGSQYGKWFFHNACHHCEKLHAPVFRCNLSAIGPLMMDSRFQGKAMIVGQIWPAIQSHKLQQLYQGLQTQRARADRITQKMCFEKPFLGQNFFRSLDDTIPMGSSFREIRIDAIDHAYGPSRQYRIAMDMPGGIVRCRRCMIRHHHPLTGCRIFGEGISRHIDLLQSHLFRQGFLGKKTKMSLSLIDHLPGFQDLEIKVFDDHVTGLRHLCQTCPRGKGRSFCRHISSDFSSTTQVSEPEIFFTPQGRTQVCRQPATGLKCNFIQNTKRHQRCTVGTEKPVTRINIQFGFDPAIGFQYPGFRLNCNHPVHEQIGWSRQPGNKPVAVKFPVRFSKGPRRTAKGEFFQLLPIEYRLAHIFSH